MSVRVRGNGAGLAAWRACSVVPFVGTRLRWLALWPIHRWWYAAWIDGVRL